MLDLHLLYWLHILEIILREVGEDYPTGRVERCIIANTGR